MKTGRNRNMASTCARRLSLYLLILLQILQARRRRLREERLRRARARLERFRRFFQRQRSERAIFVTTLASLMAELSPALERRVWMVKRTSDWWDTNHSWSERDWLDYMRMSKNTFQFICEELEEHLRKETTNMRAPIPVNKRVALTLWKMATNADYGSTAALFGVAKSTMCKILREVCDAIVHKLANQFVHPPTGTELDTVVGQFESEYGIPQCAAVLGSTHVPSGDGQTVILQFLVDHSYCILDFQVGNKMSDADNLFRVSSLYSKGEKGQLFPAKPREISGVEIPLLVIADEQYPLLDWVMTPYPGDDRQLATDQRLFNEKIAAVHDDVAETAILRLKARWHCLCTRNDNTVDFLPLLIQACCVMHNVCESLQQTFRTEWMSQDDQMDITTPKVASEDDARVSAIAVRTALTAYFAQNCHEDVV